MAKREKKPVHKVVMTEGKRNIIHQLLQEYDIETAEDIQDALKDLLGGTIKEMMEAEMDDHLGYEKSERSDNDENSEVLWVDVEEAISRDDVPELTKKLIQSAVADTNGLQYKDYVGNTKHAPYSLYCI